MVLFLSKAPKSGTLRTLRNGRLELIGFGASLFVDHARFPSGSYPPSYSRPSTIFCDAKRINCNILLTCLVMAVTILCVHPIHFRRSSAVGLKCLCPVTRKCGIPMTIRRIQERPNESPELDVVLHGSSFRLHKIPFESILDFETTEPRGKSRDCGKKILSHLKGFRE
jgi:hypothetical protein